METVTDFILGVSKITVGDDYSHEIKTNNNNNNNNKKHLLLWSRAMTNLDNVLKSRDITLPKNIHLV